MVYTNLTPIEVGTKYAINYELTSFKIGRIVFVHGFLGSAKRFEKNVQYIIAKNLPIPNSDSDFSGIEGSGCIFYGETQYLASFYPTFEGNLIMRTNNTGDFGFKFQLVYICK